MRIATTALLLTTSLFGWTAAASAQDKPAADTKPEDAAEEAFLKAYFAEKELKDYAGAEKQYAMIVEKDRPEGEAYARSLLGRARCLRAMKRDDEAAPLFARAEKEFAEFKDVAAEAHAALQASAAKTDGSLEARIRADLSMPTWRNDAWKYGERGVPVLAATLKDESPEMVYRAAESLLRMESPAAHDAVSAVLDRRADSTYPEQVRNAAESDYASIAALRSLATSKDAEVRAHALRRLVDPFGDAKSIETTAADAALRTAFLRDHAPNGTYGRVLVAALAKGGEARAAALARLRGDPMSFDVFAEFVDPPAALLSDAETLAEIGPVFATNSSPQGRTPSPSLVAAFTRLPTTAEIGVKLTLESNRASADPAAFVDAVARVGLPTPRKSKDRDDAAWIANELVAALGPKPSPDLLRRLAAAWPKYSNWETEGQRLPAFVRALVESGTTDEASLLAFQEGLRPEPLLHQQLSLALRDARPPLGAWTLKAYLRELTLPTNYEAHDQAAQALVAWTQAFGGAGLAPHVPELVAALGEGGSAHITEAMAKIEPPPIEALKAALPTHPHKANLVQTLVALGDKSSGEAIERVLAETSEIDDADRRADEVKAAATALVRVRGAASKDALAAALVAHGGRDARTIFEAIEDFDMRTALGDSARFELCRVAIAKVPGVVAAYPGATNYLPTESLRELAIRALESASVEDRRWGADQERTLLDVEAWDKLLAAAQDADTDVRDSSRTALRAIRDKEKELAEFRAMGDERATRKRIETLLASNKDEQRRAGVAAIAATNLAGMVNELIRLAAEDESDNVRDDARKALLAMAKSSAPAQPSDKK